MKNLKKNSLLWFLFMPLPIIGICSLFVPLGPSAIYDLLRQTNNIENKIKSLNQEINHILEQETLQKEEKLSKLYLELKQTQKNLIHFKPPQGNSILETLMTRIRSYRLGPGNPIRYIYPDSLTPFILLGYLALIFLAIAITWYGNIPFYIRAGSLSTGSIIGLIIITQGIVASAYHVAWYQDLVLVVNIIFIIALIFCWFLFIKNYLLKE